MKVNVFKKISITEINLLFLLAVPLILTGLVEASIAFFSTIFLARLGHQELAAGAEVAWIFNTLMVILWGTLTSVSLLVAYKYGERDDQGVTFILRDGLILALIFFIPAMLILWNVSSFLEYIGQPENIILLANKYMHALVWGVLPDFISLVLMQFLIGLGRTRTNMIFTMLWVPVNVTSNYVFMYGKLGIPALGIAGIGWGTTFAFWLRCLGLIIYLIINKEYRPYFKDLLSFKKPFFIGELSRIGVPMGAMYCIEIGFFLAVTLLMGSYGSETIAANQIVLQYGGIAFVVMFTTAQAITVRMGHTLGARDLISAERTAYYGLLLSNLFMGAIALTFWFLPTKLIGIDFNIHDPKNAYLTQMAIKFFIFSGFFQIIEGMRMALFGALRSLKDTRFTLLTSIISYWGIALPLGYVIAKYFRQGAVGLWWGIVIGASVGCTLLYLRLRIKMSKQFTSTYEHNSLQPIPMTK